MSQDKLDDVLDDLFPVEDKPAAPPKQDDQPTPSDQVSELEREGYAWAQDVYWVYEHLGDRMTRKKAKTGARYGLWQHAKADMDGFLRNILPKAMGLLEKARDKSADDLTIVEAETKSIGELKKILAAAIVEFEGMDE